VEINQSDASDAFATHFDMKIQNTLNSVSIQANVYNGTRRILSENKNFMTSEEIMDCLTSLKCKNFEGFYRIPQRILKDGAKILIKPLATLFSKVYAQKNVPAQWLVAKPYLFTKQRRQERCGFIHANCQSSQWSIAQLVERSLSVMKDPGSNIGKDICSFRY
jgi:hypothetical protein